MTDDIFNCCKMDMTLISITITFHQNRYKKFSGKTEDS